MGDKDDTIDRSINRSICEQVKKEKAGTTKSKQNQANPNGGHLHEDFYLQNDKNDIGCKKQK